MQEISTEERQRQQDFIHKIYEENQRSGRTLKAFVETYGCQQNVSDSEKLKGMLADMGYSFCDLPQEADLILYNTCAVRENAELKVFGNLGALKYLKRKKPELLIGVCGCMMQQEHIAEQIRKKYNHVDMVFGTHALYRLPEILDGALRQGRIFDVQEEEGKIAEGMHYVREAPPLAKIPIMYGCNNFCTYCIVPYVRGRERSRTAEHILEEVRAVASQGYKEVMLLGQNVNSYGNDLEDGLSFAQLLREVCGVEGIERVRFMTSHPKDLSDELIAVMAEEKKICKQLHLPLQSGSDGILEKMNRKYTVAEYMDKIRKVKAAMPDIVLTTDIIIGFPGETVQDVEGTLSVLREVEYDTIFSFIYSKRVGTPAAVMSDVMTAAEKHEQFDRLLEVQNEISYRKNEQYLNRIVSVLVEGCSKNDLDMMSGRTEGGKIVNFKADMSLVGEIVDVRITQTRTWSLGGELV